ncbi:MAG: C40 family peptidase [Bacteroidales bacterium]
MRLNNTIKHLTTILAFATLCSCSSSKQFTKQARPIEKQLNVKLNKKDNITLYREAAQWIGTPHCDGGTTKRCTDCSNLVRTLYKSVYGVYLARSSSQILEENCRKRSKSKLEEGDLVFFNTLKSNSRKPTHVGIYLKDDLFIHSSTSKGVIISNLKEPYYIKNWLTGGRVK